LEEQSGLLRQMSGLLRQMLASRRLLMILDNAAAEEKVRPPRLPEHATASSKGRMAIPLP
jgi:hypothetical protein